MLNIYKNVKSRPETSGLLGKFFLLVLLSAVATSFCWGQEIEWQNTIGGSNWDYLLSIKQTSDGAATRPPRAGAPTGASTATSAPQWGHDWTPDLDVTNGFLQVSQRVIMEGRAPWQKQNRPATRGPRGFFRDLFGWDGLAL